MGSSAIISDYLGESATKENIPEKSLIYTWSDSIDRRFNEDIIVIDTKCWDGPHQPHNIAVAGESTYEMMDFFNSTLPNLLESGRVVVGLTDYPQSTYATENRTVGFDNYHWLPRVLGSISSHNEEGESADDSAYFIRPCYDAIEPTPVRTTVDGGCFNRYFLNVKGTWNILLFENSNVTDYESIAETIGPNSNTAAAVIKSWEDDSGDVFDPEGNLVLLPRPDELKIDIDSWFKSVIEIGHRYLPDSSGTDQFNRVLNTASSEAHKNIFRICHKFPDAVRVLEERRSDREPISVNDEYDVQYLFHALLQPFFNDIRREESGPSHGGSAPRIDYLVKDDSVAIELKITRQGRAEHDIKTELAEDKEHYKTHPDCESLICYVYDPEFRFENPAAFENDFSDNSEKLETDVLISSTSRFTQP